MYISVSQNKQFWAVYNKTKIVKRYLIHKDLFHATITYHNNKTIKYNIICG